MIKLGINMVKCEADSFTCQPMTASPQDIQSNQYRGNYYFCIKLHKKIGREACGAKVQPKTWKKEIPEIT